MLTKRGRISEGYLSNNVYRHFQKLTLIYSITYEADRLHFFFMPSTNDFNFFYRKYQKNFKRVFVERAFNHIQNKKINHKLRNMYSPLLIKLSFLRISGIRLIHQTMIAFPDFEWEKLDLLFPNESQIVHEIGKIVFGTNFKKSPDAIDSLFGFDEDHLKYPAASYPSYLYVAHRFLQLCNSADVGNTFVCSKKTQQKAILERMIHRNYLP